MKYSHLILKADRNGIPERIRNPIDGRLIRTVADESGKIRAEIDRQEKWLLQAGYTAYNVDIAFDAIKSVVAERSDKE